MNPAALLTSSSAGTTGNGAGSGPARSAGRADGTGFDKVLRGQSRRADASPAGPAQVAKDKEAPNAPGEPPQAGGQRRPLTDATSSNDDDAAAGRTTAAESTPHEARMAVDEPEEANMWPPLGLAGLALSPGLPAQGNDAPVVPPTATSSGTAGPAPTPVPAMAAVLPAASGAAIALDVDAADADAALPEAMQTLLANTTPESDAASAPLTAPPLLHTLAGAGEVRTPLLAAAVFNGEPTPTPTLNDAGFDEAIGARVGWLADQRIGHAHIRLNPDDMGAIDVRLQLDGDKVHASFSSPHVDVRQALESSLPRLRDLLGEQGFQLAHADVGQHDSPGGGKPGEPRVGSLDAGDGEPSHGVVHVSVAQLARQRGLLDTYA